MFVTNWISTTKIQKISEITNFFRHYFLSRTEVYIVKKRVVICDNKKFKKITMEIFNQVKTLKIATTEKIDTIYFQYKIQGSPTLIHSKVDVKIIGYGYNNKSILMK